MAHYPHKGQSKLGNYPITNLIFSTMLALLVAGLFGVLMLQAAKLTDVIKENVKIQVYLHRNITERESIQISQLLSKKKFVLKKNGHAQIKFLSREDAAQEFIKATGENFLQILDENPLRDVYLVHIAPKYQGHAQLQAIKSELETIHGVFEVDYVVDFVGAINNNMATLGVVLATLATILLVVVSVLINNTIKLTVYSQRFLVRSMHLVGATAAFIRKPFLTRAVFIGLIASTIADILLVLLLYTANRQIETLVKLQEPFSIFILLGIIMALGVLISFVGTYRAINRYLHMPLDDLYWHKVSHRLSLIFERGNHQIYIIGLFAMLRGFITLVKGMRIFGVWALIMGHITVVIGFVYVLGHCVARTKRSLNCERASFVTTKKCNLHASPFWLARS